jgi:2-aminoadipate transaminase
LTKPEANDQARINLDHAPSPFMPSRSELAALSSLGRRTTPPPISWLMQTALERPRLISLAAGFTDDDTLPVNLVRELATEMLSRQKSGRPALQYGSTAGDPELRRLTGLRLAHLDALEPRALGTEPSSQILITNGSQQLLYLVTECLCDPGDIVLVEAPTYFVFLGILQSHGVQGRGIRMTKTGLDPDHLKTVLEDLRRTGGLARVKLLYSVTYYQNPTGITTSLAVKAETLNVLRHYEKAAGHRLYYLEDAAYRELRFAGAEVASALTLPRHRSRVLYTGTYSKPFATGVRVGYARLPEPIWSVVQRIKGNHDFGTASLLQKLLATALRTHAYEPQLAVIRRRYAQKAGLMAEQMARRFPPGATWKPAQGGLYYWVALPTRTSAGLNSRLFQAAVSGDVLYVPGELCYAQEASQPAGANELRLSYGNASDRQIATGIKRLGEVLHRFIGSEV